MNEKKQSTVKRLLGTRGMGAVITAFVGLIIIYVAFGLIDRNVFSGQNVMNLLRSMSKYLLIGVGQSYLLITGNIDLSIGSMVGMSAMVSATLMTMGVHPVIAMAVALLCCLVCGVINGTLVGKFKLPPFIATLGTMSVFRGIAYVVTGGWPVLNIPDAYRKSLGAKVIGDVPISIFVLFAIAVIAHILLKKTRFGNYLFAVGGNEEAAKLSGVNVDRTKILAYSMCGFCVAFAGMIMLANLGTGEPATGQGYELDAIAASAIGGTRMAGGKGSILGTFLGALLLAALKIGLIITGVSTFWQYIVTGIIIVIAAYFEEIQSKLSSKFSKAQA